jgi:hypothetical protein
MPHRRKYFVARRNFLNRVLEIQQFVLERQEPGQPMAFTYREHVVGRFHISLKTLYRYMGIPARKELRQVEEAIASYDQSS